MPPVGGGGSPVTVILALANHNSGAGKTVTAANVAAGFARAGRRTLAVDCDAQSERRARAGVTWQLA
jgi:chromosome partitioning protein